MNKKSSLIGIALFTAIFTALIVINSENPSANSLSIVFMIIVLFVSVFSLSKNIKKIKTERSEIDKLISDSPTHIDCDYGDYNCDFSHDNDERVKQLGEFLKNGIIDKAEYKTLLKKYSHNE